MSTPAGLSGSAAIALVQTYANEPNLPSAAAILTILNRAVEEVERRIGGIFLWAPYPTAALQTFVQLNSDIQYIESANFSSGATNTAGFVSNSSPLAQGSLVYPMFQLEQGSFMDAAAGFPAVGFGPPQAFFIYTDQGYAPSTTLPQPAAPVYAINTGVSTVTSVQAVVTYVNPNGETVPSPASSQAITTKQQAVVLSPQGVSNASGYNVYVYDGISAYWLQNSTPIALGTPYTVPSTPLTSGTNPPGSNTATGSGQGGALFMQLYPAAMIGQVNVYYRARPTLWASATSGTDFTNLDSQAQEAVVLYTVMRVLNARGRSQEAASIWKPEYEGMIESLKETIKLRTRPRSGRVRDVANRSFPSAPWWMTSS